VELCLGKLWIIVFNCVMHACVNLQCFSAFADGRNVYLVLEWCNMGTLKSYVENKKRLSEKEGKFNIIF